MYYRAWFLVGKARIEDVKQSWDLLLAQVFDSYGVNN